ncbi:MAG: AbrB/MazE/SpoVT family DNA-binding domain-containing protein [Anaerolineae bacterium]
MLVKVGPRGQITIPKSLRKRMNIKPGDSVTLTMIDDYVMLRPVTKTLFDMVGSIPVDGPLDFDVLQEEIKQHVADKVMRSLNNE